MKGKYKMEVLLELGIMTAIAYGIFRMVNSMKANKQSKEAQKNEKLLHQQLDNQFNELMGTIKEYQREFIKSRNDLNTVINQFKQNRSNLSLAELADKKNEMESLLISMHSGIYGMKEYAGQINDPTYKEKTLESIKDEYEKEYEKYKALIKTIS